MKDVLDMMPVNGLRFTIFHKMVLSLLLVVVLFYGISMYINYLSEQNTKAEVIQSSIARMNFFLSSFTGDIKRIIDIQNQFVNDSDLLILSGGANTLNEYEKAKSINDLKTKLFMFMGISKYINDIRVQIPMIQSVISVKSSIDDLLDKDYKLMSSFRSVPGNLFLPEGGGLFLNIPYPTNSDNVYMPVYNLYVSISKNEIRNTMLQVFNVSNGGSILIGKDNGWEVETNDAVASGIKKQLMKSENYISGIKHWSGVFRIDSRNYWVISEYSDDLDARLVVFVPENVVLGQLIKYRYWYLGLSVFSILLLVVYAYWVNYKFGSPMRKLVYAFKRIEKGELAYSISHKSNDEFSYLYTQFNSMIQKVEKLIHQVYEQRIMTQQAELKQLQYQINPHFLYNSIYLIYRMAIMQDYNNITRLTKHLVGYYKCITRSTSDNVPLEQEVAHALDYVEVQSIRFGNRIKAEFGDIPEGCTNILVPPLILQPVVENAYGHGLEENSKEGLIRIKMIKDERFLLIFIEDNGKGIENEKLRSLQQDMASTERIHNTTGLLNVHCRLSILYGSECGLSISESDLGGLCVIIKIPLEGSSGNV